jgi:hypothetical protein
VSSSTGGLTAWTLSVVGIASSIMIAALVYIMIFDLPPATIAFAMSLFKSGSPPAPAAA